MAEIYSKDPVQKQYPTKRESGLPATIFDQTLHKTNITVPTTPNTAVDRATEQAAQ
jgi:hypothetical protein